MRQNDKIFITEIQFNNGYIEVNNGEIIESENVIEIESPTSPNLNKIKGENNNG